MSELKAIRSGEIYNIIEYEDCNRTDDLYYHKSEVDATIAELKAENRRLKRELWIARAERAKWVSLYYWYGLSDKAKSRKFDKVECKCRIKAEEYK